MDSITYKNNVVWHAGNLTNLNQLTNGPGYLTSLPSHNHDGVYMKTNRTLDTINTIDNGGDRYNPSVNNPTDTYYAVLTYGNGGNVTGQLATHFVTGQLYSRGHNSSWSSWKKYVVEDGGNWGINISGTATNITAYTINQNLGTSNNVKFASHVDLNITGSAFRFYDGTTFRGGLGLDDWAHSGSAANITLFAAGVLHFTSGGTKRAYFDTSGHLLPQVNNTYNLGSASLGWANVYTNDLHLSNMNKPEGNDIDGTKGTWTIQEGVENLYIINNNNGKKFKISLEEII
jgi:hypothetical protein